MVSAHLFGVIPEYGSLSFGDWVFILSNIIIPLGYIFIAIKVLPLLPVSSATKWSARAFFVLCALTHIDQTAHTLFLPNETYRESASQWHMLFIHVPQALAIWVFAVYFFVDLKRLFSERRGSHRSTGVPHADS